METNEAIALVKEGIDIGTAGPKPGPTWAVAQAHLLLHWLNFYHPEVAFMP